jgi:AcrR family transcriptional regulator
MPRPSTADQKRLEIVSTAALIFDTDGYNATNVDSIAQAVGLKKPSLYHYFAGKDEILFWVHEEFIDLLISQYEARADAGLSAADSLREIMIDILRLMDTHRGHVRVFFEHHRELSKEHKVTITAKRDRYTGMVEAEIERGIRDGEFRDLSPHRLTALALFGMCNWSYQWYQTGGARTSQEVAEYFWDLLMNGLRAED